MKNNNDKSEPKRLMELAGIKEGEKKFLTNESFSESNKHEETDENKKDNEDFIVFELNQKSFGAGQDDDLYKLG